LDDSASAVFDSGDLMPEGFITDLHIWIPEHTFSVSPLKTLRYLYLSSAAVTPGIVSFTILGCADPIVPAAGGDAAAALTFEPVASISLQRSVVTPYTNYSIEALLDGVKGWVSFGESVVHGEFNGLFSTPQQSMILPKAVRQFKDTPVKSVGIDVGFSTIIGDVTITAEDPVTVSERAITVDGVPKTAMVFDMALDPDTLESFAGECAGRPESGSCDRPAITSIAGVTPDCDGNLTVNFINMTVRQFDTAGLCIDTEVEMSEVCDAISTLPNADGVLPYDHEWSRPCRLVVPYSANFYDVELYSELVPEKGVWLLYVYDGALKAYTSMFGVAVSSTCLQTLPVGETTRTVTVGYDDISAGLPVGGEIPRAGICLCQQTPNRFVALYYKDGSLTLSEWRSGEEINVEGDIAGEESVLATFTAPGTTGFTAVVEDKKISVGAESYTFADSDPYWYPNGKIGLLVAGPIVSSPVTFASLTVT